jgi:hypothetical protein
MAGRSDHGAVGRVLLAAACAWLAGASFHAAHAGDVKSGLVLYIADDDEVTFVDQGHVAYPGAVGGAATNLPYAIDWDGISPGSILWKDTNGSDVLFVDYVGLDVLIAGGVANSNGSITGNMDLGASSWTGSRLRQNYGLGAHGFVDTIFTNGSTVFTVSGCVTIGHPDLRTLGPYVSDGTLDPGQAFEVRANAWNLGQGTCEGTTLRFYLSTDSTIETSDTQIATRPVSPLMSTGSAQTISATVTAPTDGRYWVGGCVDTVTGEAPTDNQCSTGIKIRVGPSCDTLTVAHQTLGTMQTHQACRRLVAGPDLTVTSGEGVRLYGGETVELVTGFSVTSGAQLRVGTCGHDICTPRPYLSALTPCMPCVAQVCETSPGCCLIWWNQSCVDIIGTVCGLACP